MKVQPKKDNTDKKLSQIPEKKNLPIISLNESDMKLSVLKSKLDETKVKTTE